MLSIVVTVVFLALGVRLFYLQVIEGDNYYRMTAENIIRTVALPATRGQIRDRKGRVLATMVPSYDIEVLPSQITRESYDHLRALLGPDIERMMTWEAIQAEATKGKDRTLVVAENVSRDVMAQLETSLDKPGIHVAAVQRRHYPNGALAAHAIGYLNEVSAEDASPARTKATRPATPSAAPASSASGSRTCAGTRGSRRSWSTGAACGAPIFASPT